MPDRDVQRILQGLGGPATARPGFKQELAEVLGAELDGEEPDGKAILRLIQGPVAPRPGFRAELAARLVAELEDGEPTVVPAGAAASRRGRLGRLVGDRLKGGWWMQSAAALVALAIVASGFAWTNCLQGVDVGERQLAAPDAPGTASDGPPAQEPVPERPGVAQTPSPAPAGEPAGDAGGAPGDAPASGDQQTDPGVPSVNPPGEPPVGPPDPAPQVLAFASRTSGYWHIFTMHEDGTHRAQLTRGPIHDREPEWSPDGKRIAFMRIENEEDHHGRIFIMKANGSGLRFLVDGAEPVWSPDGTRIAYAAPTRPEPLAGSSWSIWIIDVDGSNARPLPLAGSNADPSWSPRGNLISFARVLADPTEPALQSTNVFTVRPDGSRVRRLTDNPYACNTSVSPDGHRIAYVAMLKRSFNIWTMDADGSDQRQATFGRGSDFYPHWSPDGSRIAFGRDPDGEPHWTIVPTTAGPAPSAIWSVRTDGSRLRRVSPPGVDDADPAYRPEPRRKPGGFAADSTGGSESPGGGAGSSFQRDPR